MELIERLLLKPIQWLSQLSYSEFVETCLSKSKKHSSDDAKTSYSLLEQFCKTNLKTSGITKRIYSYSLTTPLGLGGRLFSGGSLQGLPSSVRGLLMNNNGTDIDMTNAHPVILLYICKLHNITCPHLEYYINHREKCLEKFETRDKGKDTYLKATNNDKMNRAKNLPIEFKKYDLEMKQIQKKLVDIEKYKELVDAVPVNKSYNKIGSAINRILCYYENIILQHAIHVVNTKGIEIAILMFDGLMIYGNYYKNKDLLSEISYYVEKQMPGLNMKWAYKEHNICLVVPDDFKYEESKNINKTTFVCNDLEAAQKLYTLYPYWKYSENELYVFDDKTGLWKNDRISYNLVVSRFTNDLWVGVKGKHDCLEASKIKSYGNTTTLFIQMLEKLKTLCIDDQWLKKSASSSLGKLLFSNGYLDLRSGVFHKSFNSDILFTGKIHQEYNDKYTVNDLHYMESIKQRLFYEPLGREVGDFFILNLARGLAGDVMKRILFGLGSSNTGKSTITKALLKTCSDYVGTFDGNNFAYRNTSNDSASQNRWLMLLKNKRLIFSNEIKSTIPLNGNLIKMVSSGGDSVIGRQHAGNECEFYLSFLAVVFANDLPKITPYDDAVNNRVRVVSYTKPYIECPVNKHELKMDPNIDAEFDTLTFQRCFLEVFIQQYYKWKQGEFSIEPLEVTQAKEDWIGTDIGCLPAFLKDYELTNDETDYIKSSEVQEWLELGKYGITMKKFGMEMKQYTLKHTLDKVKSGGKKINGLNKQVWYGVKSLYNNIE